jgi:hypothetical protein
VGGPARRAAGARVVARRHWPALGLGFAALAVVAVLVLVALRGEERRVAPSEVRPTVRAFLSPQTHLFGERVTAQIELLAKKEEFQPGTETITVDFAPYRIVGSPRKEVRDLGPDWQLRYAVTLQCLRTVCLPAGETREIEFPDLRIAFKSPPPPGRKFKDRRLDQRVSGADLLSLKVATRLGPTDLNEARWRSSLRELPAVSFRVSPGWLTFWLLAGAAVLVAVAAGALGVYVRRVQEQAWIEEEAEAAAEASPLEQALDLVLQTSGNGQPQMERMALEALARELRKEGRGDLADSAERLAWHEEPPSRAAVETLSAEIRNGRPVG